MTVSFDDRFVGEHASDPNVWMAVAFDHEEVGSSSVPGAGMFLPHSVGGGIFDLNHHAFLLCREHLR